MGTNKFNPDAYLWTTHDGKSTPPSLVDGRTFYVRLRDGSLVESDCVEDHFWAHHGSGNDVVRWCQHGDDLPFCEVCGWLNGEHAPGCTELGSIASLTPRCAAFDLVALDTALRARATSADLEELGGMTANVKWAPPGIDWSVIPAIECRPPDMFSQSNAWPFLTKPKPTLMMFFNLDGSGKAGEARPTLVTMIEHPAQHTKPVGWQPIETAPRDGTLVDLWVDHGQGNGKRIACCKYDAGSSHPDWVERSYGILDVISGTPTHWMPIPEAPKKSKTI